ncbi:hypothetical protein BURKHO8Y_20009 [Burkholderia sp. 8Y]|nr:hypothetical protein BURKHO8Y_20009 [Burkholderia sp. 8Y]
MVVGILCRQAGAATEPLQQLYRDALSTVVDAYHAALLNSSETEVHRLSGTKRRGPTNLK